MKNKNGIRPVDLTKVKTYPIRDRENKVSVTDFAYPASAGQTISSWLDSLPKILAGRDFIELVQAIVKAKAESRPVIAMMGGHVVKCGLSPVIISMMEHGILTGIAMNGATSIHDFEIAIIGGTSEDVGTNIEDGMFGMWDETGGLMNEAINERSASHIPPLEKNLPQIPPLEKGDQGGFLGMGEALGQKLIDINAEYQNMSILASAVRLNIPATVHVAIGTDIIHQHPQADGSAIGQTSFIDFRIFVAEVSDLEGGVLINFGSAVIMPEVFLKALSIARNLGHKVTEFTTANFDIFQHYRPKENILKRPINMGGVGYAITGHHEIMIPLLACAVMDKMLDR
jgi:hypothetical protein